MSPDGVATERRLSNPFPGLRPFEMHEAHLFFGRDGQSDEIIRRLARTRFVGVVGTSGSGKSSLVRAGLLPALHGGFMTNAGSSWRIAIIRPGNNPIRNLAATLVSPDVFGSKEEDEQIATAILEATLRRSGLGLIEASRLADMAQGENLLIVVDQFEELFRFKEVSKDLAMQDEAASFVKLLLEAPRQTDVPIYVVLTMRSEYLGDCAQFPDLAEVLNDGQYLIPRMTRDQRREAIEGPVAVGGGEIAPRLVQRLLNDVGDDPDQLPILQHALMRTWQHWEKSREDDIPIDLADYEVIGGLSQALDRHADEAYTSLSERQQKIAEKLFKSLTEKDADNRKIRRTTSLEQIRAVAEAEQDEVIEVIDRFRKDGHWFLMPPVGEELTGDKLIDISHESLIRKWKRLEIWVEEECASRDHYLRIVEEALGYQTQPDEGRLWRDPKLKLALDWRESAKPNQAWAKSYNPNVELAEKNFELAEKFLAESKVHQDAEVSAQERQRWLITRGVTVLMCLNMLVLCSGLSWFFIHDQERDLHQFLLDSGIILSKQLAHNSHYAVLVEERSALEQYLSGLMEVEEVVYGIIRDGNGRIIAQATKGKLQDSKSASRSPDVALYPPDEYIDLAILEEPSQETVIRHFSYKFDNGAEKIYDVMTPIISRTSPEASSLVPFSLESDERTPKKKPRLIGLVQVGMSEIRVMQALMTNIKNSTLITSLALVWGIASTLYLAKKILRPLKSKTER